MALASIRLEAEVSEEQLSVWSELPVVPARGDTMIVHKHKLYFVGFLFERYGKTYAFRCDECLRPFYMNTGMFWKGVRGEID